MRFFGLALTALLLTLSPAMAQDSSAPLYNSGAKPLSLKQITDGVSQRGYAYSRTNSGQRPYGSGASSGYPSQADVAAFRKRRAAEAQAQEKAALASLQQVHTPPPNTGAAGATALPTLPGVTPGQPAGTNQPRVRQQYKGRDTGVTIPPKVFNSVR